MKRPLVALLIWAAAGPGLGVRAIDPPPDTVSLARVLEQLDRVAGLYRDTALKFSCDEKIVHARPGFPSRFHEFRYVYEFSEESGLVDYRVDRLAPQRAAEAPPARLSSYELPYFVTRGYSFIFMFDRAHQARHRYALGAETPVMGRPALPIAFEPISPIESDVNDWYGTLWADASSLQPLRIEAIKQPDHEQEQAFQGALNSTGPLQGPSTNGWAFARVQAEFSQEKNGMRFPGRITINGTLARIRIRKGKRVPDERSLFTVTQLYTNYRFFGVKTIEEIRRLGTKESNN